MEDNDPLSAPTLSISHCVTLKLSSKNYLLWKTQFESFLSSQSLLGFVNGTLPRPSPTVTVRNEDAVVEEANPSLQNGLEKTSLLWLGFSAH